jgi:hypothetical protein
VHEVSQTLPTKYDQPETVNPHQSPSKTEQKLQFGGVPSVPNQQKQSPILVVTAPDWQEVSAVVVSVHGTQNSGISGLQQGLQVAHVVVGGYVSSVSLGHVRWKHAEGTTSGEFLPYSVGVPGFLVGDHEEPWHHHLEVQVGSHPLPLKPSLQPFWKLVGDDNCRMTTPLGG